MFADQPSVVIEPTHEGVEVAYLTDLPEWIQDLEAQYQLFFKVINENNRQVESIEASTGLSLGATHKRGTDHDAAIKIHKKIVECLEEDLSTRGVKVKLDSLQPPSEALLPKGIYNRDTGAWWDGSTFSPIAIYKSYTAQVTGTKAQEMTFAQVAEELARILGSHRWEYIPGERSWDNGTFAPTIERFIAASFTAKAGTYTTHLDAHSATSFPGTTGICDWSWGSCGREATFKLFDAFRKMNALIEVSDPLFDITLKECEAAINNCNGRPTGTPYGHKILQGGGKKGLFFSVVFRKAKFEMTFGQVLFDRIINFLKTYHPDINGTRPRPKNEE